MLVCTDVPATLRSRLDLSPAVCDRRLVAQETAVVAAIGSHRFSRSEDPSTEINLLIDTPSALDYCERRVEIPAPVHLFDLRIVPAALRSFSAECRHRIEAGEWCPLCDLPTIGVNGIKYVCSTWFHHREPAPTFLEIGDSDCHTACTACICASAVLLPIRA